MNIFLTIHFDIKKQIKVKISNNELREILNLAILFAARVYYDYNQSLITKCIL